MSTISPTFTPSAPQILPSVSSVTSSSRLSFVKVLGVSPAARRRSAFAHFAVDEPLPEFVIRYGHMGTSSRDFDFLILADDRT